MRQYRACVIDSLGLGITCVIYHSTMCTRHPDLVSFAFYAIPTFHIIIRRIFNVLVYSHFLITVPNLLITLVKVSTQQCYEQQKKYYVVGNSCTCIRREMHVYTGCIGGLLANTVYCIEVTVSVLLRHDSPHLPSWLMPARRDGSRWFHGKLSV